MSVRALRALRAASPSPDRYWKPVSQVWSQHPKCHPESSTGSQQEHTALQEANGSTREGSAPACCGCAAQGQSGGADSCTGAEITMDLESAQSWCHMLQDLHMTTSKSRLLLFTVPHSWLSLPDKTCTQPELADAQHWLTVCVQIWPVHSSWGT